MASVTIAIPNSNWFAQTNDVLWEAPTNSRISLGSSLAATGGQELFLGRLSIPRNIGTNFGIGLADNQTESISLAGPDFSDQFEASGSITLTASNGASLTHTGGIDEVSPPNNEPYVFPPSDLAAARAFADTLAGLADRSLTITFNDGANQPPVISNLVANPMSVASGGDVMLSATVTDPNMDMLTYSWSANPPLGSFSDPSALNTVWTAHSPLVDQTVMLTLTADDSQDTSSASISVTVGGRQFPASTSPYLVLVDVNEDGFYAANIYPFISALQFSAGASGARRQGISAVAGQFSCLLNNSDNFFAVSDLEDKPILVRRGSTYLWSGIVDNVEDMSEKGTRRELKLTALGILTTIGGSVPADISRSGDIPASEAISLLTGETILAPSPQEVSNWSVDAGDDILRELRAIQDSSGTRIYEDSFSGIQVASQGVAELWDLVLADDQPEAGDRLTRRFRKEKPKSGIINAAVIDNVKYVDSDSVDAYGEVLHPSDFEFAVPAEAATIAADQFGLYAQPADIFRVSILLEQLAGAGDINEILEDLHYGNERLLRVRQKGVVSFVEIMRVSHSIGRGEKHIINLELRERSIAGLVLTLCTYYDREVGYFATLPELSADGLRAITGHKIQFRETGTTDWMDAVSSETALAVNDTFTVPTADEEYDVRLVATSATGDEQTSPTQTFKALAAEPRYEQISSGAPPMRHFVRQYRLYTDKVRAATTELRIIGFDWQARQLTWPEGWPASYYDVDASYAPPYAFPGSGQDIAANAYAVIIPIRAVTLIPLGTIGFDYQGGLLQSFPYVHPISTNNPNDMVDGTAQLRFRPVFHSAGANLLTGERGLWTPWLDSVNDITTQY